MNTRLQKLDNDEYDAIILASAGLISMETKDHISSYLMSEQSLPAMGQSSVCIECRVNDEQTQQLIAPLAHKESTIRLTADRALNKRLEGGCQVPIGGYAELDGQHLSMRAFVGSAEQLGIQLADELLAKGAKEILDEVYKNGI